MANRVERPFITGATVEKQIRQIIDWMERLWERTCTDNPTESKETADTPHLIQSGETTDGWEYRKYQGGDITCRKIISRIGESVTAAIGQMYESAEIRVSVPSHLFAADTTGLHAHISVTNTETWAGGRSYDENTGELIFRLLSPVSVDITYTTVYIEIHGKWK